MGNDWNDDSSAAAGDAVGFDERISDEALDQPCATAKLSSCGDWPGYVLDPEGLEILEDVSDAALDQPNGAVMLGTGGIIHPVSGPGTRRTGLAFDEDVSDEALDQPSGAQMATNSAYTVRTMDPACCEQIPDEPLD